MLHAILAAVVLGIVSAFGDFLWAGSSLRQRVVYGLVHGALICLCIGAFVGWDARRTAAGAAAGPIIGLIAAASFYAMAPAFGYYAMFPAWMVFWICFAVLQKTLRRERRWGPAILAGLAAAVLAGAAFYAVSGIWIRPLRGGPNYLYNLGAWTFAFFPGFAVLFARPTERTAKGAPEIGGPTAG